MNQLPYSVLDFSHRYEECVIPSQKMIEQATRMPVFSREFAYSILKIYEAYGYQTSSELTRILVANKPKLWEELTEELGRAVEADLDSSKYNPKLYAYFSLQKYRNPNYTDRDFNLLLINQSDPIFRIWSDRVVSNLSRQPDYQNHIRALRSGDYSNNRNMYHKFLYDYCLLILPSPLRYRYSHTADRDNIYQQDTPYKKTRLESVLRASMRFSALNTAIDIMSKSVDKQQKQEGIKHQISAVYDTESSRRRDGLDSTTDLLCQCQFCYRYKGFDVSRQVNGG